MALEAGTENYWHCVGEDHEAGRSLSDLPGISQQAAPWSPKFWEVVLAAFPWKAPLTLKEMGGA